MTRSPVARWRNCTPSGVTWTREPAGRPSPARVSPCRRSSRCPRVWRRCCSRIPAMPSSGTGPTGRSCGRPLRSSGCSGGGRATSSAPPSGSHPIEDQERLRSAVVDAMTRGDDGVTVRLRARRADGSLGWADTATVFIRDVDGNPAGSVASIRDVTAEVEAEERYRLLAENATDMVFLRDADGTITWASPSTRAVLGNEPEDDRSGRTRWTTCIPTTDPWRSAVRAQVGSGEPSRGVVARIRLADGSYRYMSLASHPVTRRVRRRGRCRGRHEGRGRPRARAHAGRARADAAARQHRQHARPADPARGGARCIRADRRLHATSP